MSWQYEWWVVNVTTEVGAFAIEFKGKSKAHIIKQINKAVADSNSEENAKRDVWHRQPKIICVDWDSLRMVRKGYQRLY